MTLLLSFTRSTLAASSTAFCIAICSLACLTRKSVFSVSTFSFSSAFTASALVLASISSLSFSAFCFASNSTFAAAAVVCSSTFILLHHHPSRRQNVSPILLASSVRKSPMKMVNLLALTAM
ncbi:hypothetical protein EI94DRAFT_1723354 [Lactarius quietus]|nr:hypothetical protein EI94DRAFT_1723354 [Lactarius quietus]